MDQISQLLGKTDIYLLDQIMKGRYNTSEKILDAGAGKGRNLHWFAQHGFQVYGIDRNPDAVSALQSQYSQFPSSNFQQAVVKSLPFSNAFFNHIICCAVLHFAENPGHLEQMFGELIRVLKPGGSLFIRVATDVGLADKMVPLGDGRFQMPDGTDRFLLTRPAVEKLVQTHQLNWLEPFKVINVNDLRSMATLVFQKPI